MNLLFGGVLTQKVSLRSGFDARERKNSQRKLGQYWKSKKICIDPTISGGLSLSAGCVFTCREAARSCRSVGRKKNKKKGLMDFETLKPLFVVLFGILSCFEPV